jgi:hypothetical protein
MTTSDRVMKNEGSHVIRIPLSLLYRAATLAFACALATNGGLQGAGTTSYVFAAIAGLLALRTLAIRVVVSPDELRIVNPFRSYRIKWKDVENVRYEDRGLAWIGRGIGARRHRVILGRKTGIEISIAASQSMHRDLFGHSFFDKERTQQCLENIREAWASASSG